MKLKHTITFVLFLFGSTFIFGQYLSFTQGYLPVQDHTTIPEISVNDRNSQFLDVEFNFTGAIISEVEVNSTAYQQISIEGFSPLQIEGAPAVPVHSDRIALPPGAEARLEILGTKSYYVPCETLYPSRRPATDTEGDPEPPFVIDKSIYEKDDFYPQQEVRLVSTSLYRGLPIVLVQIAPVLYNPVSKMLRVFSQINYRIIFDHPSSGLEQVAQKNSQTFTNQLKKSVLNPGMIPDGISNRSPNTENGSDYIIITHEAFLSQAQQLAQWKRQLGYRVEIVSQASWTAGEVKNAIQTRYDTWIPKPDYFVIIGDHTGAYAVPGNIHLDPFYNNTFATDLDFACMDGPDDWHPDMAHGRISVSTVAEAQIVVDKIINYEKNPVNDPAFYSTSLNCAQYQDDDNNGFADRRFCHTSEEIHDYLTNQQGYVNDRVYYTTTHADKTNLRFNNGYYSGGTLLPAELRDPSFSWNGSSGMITSEINAGKFMVFHRDHGYVGGAGWAHPYYTTSTMDDLNNGNELPVVFSINCHTGEYQLDNCFAEKFLRMENKGAVGVVAAAYYSFSGFNDALSEGMIDAIWPDPGLSPLFGAGGSGNSYTIGPGNAIYTMGDVVNQGLYAMEMNWGGSSSSNYYQYELFHWFGDPAMKIWTSDPYQQLISAQHNPDIFCEETTFEVSSSCPGALATLVNDDQIIGKAVLDASGYALIPYTISSNNPVVYLTISMHNHKPCIDTLILTGSCAFAPALTSLGVYNVTNQSATFAGSITDDFGAAVQESGFVYSSEFSNPEIGQPETVKLTTDPLISMGQYSLIANGLSSGTSYYVRAYAANFNGIGYGDVLIFETPAATLSIPYQQDFENNASWPSGWETDNPDVWTLSTQWYGQSNPGGYHVLSDRLPEGTGTVYSPIFNATNKSNLRISFINYWQADYPGSTQDGYLYGSRDGGLSYPYLIDEWHHDDPSWEEGEKEYDISIWADGFDGVKFKWVVSQNSDWYWEIDNFGIFEAPAPGLWTGNVSTDWSADGNWNDGMIPDALTDVLVPSIPAGGNYPELNTGDVAECNNLTIEMGAHLFIPPGNGLTVNGDLINQEGINGLVIESAAPGVTGSLIHHTPYVEATVQQYLEQMKWHLVGIPVAEATAEVFYLPGQSDIYLNAFLEPTGSWGPWIVDITTPLDAGRGYECWVDNNVDQDETVMFTGVLNYGELTTGTEGFVNLEFTPGEGFNLISNPFPCGINADIDSWPKRGLSNTVWVWDEKAGNYLYWNSTNSNNSNGFGTLPGGYIPPMQGFFVYADQASPQLSFPENCKVQVNQSLYKATDDIENTLRLDVMANSFQDAIFISFNPDASSVYDTLLDALKFWGLENAPQLYMQVQDKNLSINSLPFPESSLAVPLKLECSGSSLFTFKASGLIETGKHISAFLEDLKSGQWIDLQQEPEYSFNYESGVDTDRFVLHFGALDVIHQSPDDWIGIYTYGNQVYIHTSVDNYYRVSIFDLNGKPVYSTHVESAGLHSFIPDIPPAVYITKITGANHQVIRKVMIR